MLKPQPKIRVLHIITNLPVGGAQDNTLITVERLDRHQFDVTLMCSPDGEWRERAENIPDLELIFVDALTRPVHPFYDTVAFWKLCTLIKRGGYDIVHTHSSKPGVLGRLAARVVGTPVIIHTIHGFPFNDFMPRAVTWGLVVLERWLSRLTDRLITVSKLNLEKATRLKLAPPEKFVNIYSGIDFHRFDTPADPARKKAELGVGNGAPVVGMVGRLSKQKAPLNFVRAIPHVLQQRRDARFVLVGDGELRQSVETLARKLGVADKLCLLGYRDDVPELLRTFDVYVLPSLWEGLGRSLTEAMYSGCPVVATSVEGVPELVRHEETGLLVEPNDVPALAARILELLNDRDKAQRLARAAKQRIDENFRADVMVRALERVYQETLAAKKVDPDRVRHPVRVRARG